MTTVRSRRAGRAAVRRRRGVAGVAVFLLGWELAGRSGAVDSALLPLASDSLARAARLATDEAFLADVGSTLLAAAIGLAVAIGVAVPAGTLLGTLPRVEAVLRPIIEFMRPIPSVALIPLALLVFTHELSSKVALVVYAASWPILVNTIYGLRDVDPLAQETLRGFGFGPVAVLWRVSLPSAAPFIATGIRLAAAITLILAISTEYIAGGAAGIGRFLIQASSGTDAMPDLVAVTLWTGFVGLLVNGLLVGVERRLFRWREAAGQ